MATFTEKLKLLQGLLTGDWAYIGPFFVNVDVTRRCNLRCIGCRFHSPLLKEPQHHDTPVEDISLPLFERLCGELKSLKTRTITLTGEGEPLLHPDLPEIIYCAKKHGFVVTLVTNGTLLNADLIQCLLETRLDILKVSIWAGSKNEYEENYPGTNPLFFTKVLQGLKLLAAQKSSHHSKLPFVVLHHPITRLNHFALEKIVDLALTTGCDALSFSPTKTFKGKFDSLALDPAAEKQVRDTLIQIGKQLDTGPLKHNVDEIIKRYSIGGAVWQKMPCYIAWLHARVLVDGTVLPCHRSFLAMGNLNNCSLQDVWNNGPYRTFRRKAAQQQSLEECDCHFCGFVVVNTRIHQFFKWFAPLTRVYTRILRS
ncbi:radical SAM protein [candidate division CSSED10-310 bacterium]|uniref:Radical SAM protein n=1 Tax=candidate division CSSED10-310 bacterium TaxID=2855610 RepID=A0ABV6YZ01_UNCC1